MKTAMEQIEGIKSKISPYYCMNISDMDEIEQNSADKFSLICNSFNLGYVRGAKAAKAEMRAAK